MSDVRIITLDPDRWQEYRDLRLRALREEPSAFGSSYEDNVDKPEADWRRRLEGAQRKTDEFLLFAEVDGRLVGMMGAYRDKGRKVAHIATVVGVYVDAAARGQGIGRRLMQALLDEIARVPQIEKLRLGVNTQRFAPLALYLKFGFEIVGTARHELKIGDTYCDEYLMEKLLEKR